MIVTGRASADELEHGERSSSERDHRQQRMRGALGGGRARLLERRVDPQQVVGEDAHGGADQRRDVAGVRRLPSAVIGDRRHLGQRS